MSEYSFHDFEGGKIKIWYNLNVKVLENYETLLARLKQKEKHNVKTRKNRKLFMKSRVVLKLLNKKFCEVGRFYNVNEINGGGAVNLTKESKVKVDDNLTSDLTVTDKKHLSDQIISLKGQLCESEKKLREKKMKITSLKISLANLEKKNAEKKLSLQKKDERIKELEEETFKRLSSLKEGCSEDDFSQLRLSVEKRILDLELQLVKRNATIKKLEEEN